MSPSPNLSRRDALKALAAGATAALSLPAIAAAETTQKSRASSAAFKQSVCRWCYKDMPFEKLCAAARDIGLESIELLGPDDWPMLKKYGLTCAMANGATTIPDGFNRVENHARLVPAFEQRLREAADAGLPNVICFSGNRRGLDDEAGLENCVTGIKQIMPAAERHGVTVCMELLNSRVNHKDYQCDRTPWGVELVKRVGSERFKLLFDIYHMQIMEGDVIRTIRDNKNYIRHYHTAGNPGRNEFTRPEDIQELDYASIMRAIADTGFKGFVGQEFIPTRDPLESLREAVELCRV
ncbi:MAG: hydroxypyruvate isomerase family protein [Opitutaceae bacterium]